MSLGSGSNFFLGAASAGAGGYKIERSLRFNSADSAYLNRTPSSAGNRKTWTWAGWVKRVKLDTFTLLFEGAVTNTNEITRIIFDSNNKFDVLNYLSPTPVIGRRTTSQVFRDTSAWYHFVVAFDTTNAVAADRIKVYVNGVQVTSFSSTVDPALNSDTYVNATNFHGINAEPGPTALVGNFYAADYYLIDGQALDPTDFGEFDDNGVWQPIEYAGTYGTNGFHLPFSDNSTAAALGTDTSGNGNDWTVNNITPGPVSSTVAGMAWSTALNTEPTWSSFPSLTTIDTYSLANPTSFTINSLSGIGSNLYFGYWWSSDGVSWTRSGSDAVSPPYTVTTVNRYLRLALAGSTIVTSATAGTETFTSAFVDADSLFDSPTNGTQTDTGAGGEVSGNYATLQPLDLGSINTLTNGNLQVTSTTGANWSNGKSCGTIGVSSGKWYWEHTQNSNQYTYTGVGNIKSGKLDDFAGETANSYGWLSSTATTYNNASGTSSNAPSMPTGGGTVMIALDLDNGKIWWGLDGTWVTSGSSPNPATGTDPAYSGLDTTQTWFPLTGLYDSMDLTFNFGQRAFAYSAPSGYKALCTANLPDPTIADGSTAMDTKLYTGTEATLTISGYNFAPDLVWRKGRQAVGGSITETPNHLLFDTVRGAGKRLISNDNSQEDTSSTTLTAFTSDGFTLGSSTDGNDAPQTYAAWAWDAGTSTVSNTDGTITSSVRANPSAGFSIVTYTGNGTAGATVGHGLNAAPDFVICKRRDSAEGWRVGHVSPGWTRGAYLHVTDAFAPLIGFWNNTAPTSSVVTLGTYPNTNTGTYVMYCFAPVEGYSSFGSYTGNGSADGPFIYTGFKPRWIMMKASSTTGSWVMYDTQRDPIGTGENWLYANTSAAEVLGATYAVQVTSNGFKMVGTSPENNGNGNTYIYACFAEKPFKTARAR